MDVQADFAEDLRESAREHLRDLGFRDADVVALGDPVAAFYEVDQRRLRQQPRTTRPSGALQANPKSVEHREALAQIVAAVEAGDDLTPWQSTKIKRDLRYTDRLLADWGIQHLHLGTETQANGFVKRSGDLLYVYEHRDDLLLVDILDHDLVDGFANQRLVQILHDEWPEVIERHRAHGLGPVDISNEQRRNLRGNRMNAVVQVEDGTQYFGMGGGYMFSGRSARARIMADRHDAAVRELEGLVRKRAPEIAEAIGEQTGVAVDTLTLRLVPTPKGWSVVEPTRGIVVLPWWPFAS